MSKTVMSVLTNCFRADCFSDSYVPSQQPCVPDPTIHFIPLFKPARTLTMLVLGISLNGNLRNHPGKEVDGMLDQLTCIPLDNQGPEIFDRLNQSILKFNCGLPSQFTACEGDIRATL